jgi:hypothetical protein
LLAFCACAAPVPWSSYEQRDHNGHEAAETEPEDATSEAATTSTSTSTTASSAQTSIPPPSPSGACVAPAGLELQDQDLTDEQKPWQRRGAERVVIFFETKKVSAEFLEYMKKGVENWNRSPCLDTRLVDTCPANANCVTVTAPESTADDDGNFDEIEKGDFTIGGHIEVASNLTKGERQNVMIHEMGHAVGLRHRKTPHVLMNGETYDDVFASDAIDYQNLLVLYGRQK